MKKVVYFCFLLLLLASCSRPAWHKTADGVYVYCIANDKYPLKWSGNVVGCLADGDGDLISYKNNGEVKTLLQLSTKCWSYFAPKKKISPIKDIIDCADNWETLSLRNCVTEDRMSAIRHYKTLSSVICTLCPMCFV